MPQHAKERANLAWHVWRCLRPHVFEPRLIYSLLVPCLAREQTAIWVQAISTFCGRSSSRWCIRTAISSVLPPGGGLFFSVKALSSGVVYYQKEGGLFLRHYPGGKYTDAGGKREKKFPDTPRPLHPPWTKIYVLHNSGGRGRRTFQTWKSLSWISWLGRDLKAVTPMWQNFHTLQLPLTSSR